MLNPAIMISAVSIAIAIVMTFLYQGEVKDHANYRATVEQIQAELEADAEKARLERQRIDQQTSDAWADALAYARRGDVVRVRPSACQSSLRPVSGAPGIVAPAHEQKPGPSPVVDVAVEECQTRINSAVIDAAWIEHVKSWVDDQHNATTKKD